jgi:signal transduction histidine kinase
MALCLMWLSRHRYRQALAQLRARQAAEARLADALALNRELSHQHLRMQEAERKHLARELHDELGQYLNAIKIDAVTLREPMESEAAAAISERMVIAVDHVYAVVSDMIRRLRPAGLDELGLVAALENCLDHWRQRVPSRTFTLHVRGTFDGLPELTNLTLYRLVQEGLTNSHKHADAAKVEVVLNRETAAGDELVLSVSDDGRGGDATARSGGFGLRGMQERIEMSGGRFSIDTSPGAGFSFEARLPAA